MKTDHLVPESDRKKEETWPKQNVRELDEKNGINTWAYKQNRFHWAGRAEDMAKMRKLKRRKLIKKEWEWEQKWRG